MYMLLQPASSKKQLYFKIKVTLLLFLMLYFPIIEKRCGHKTSEKYLYCVLTYFVFYTGSVLHLLLLETVERLTPSGTQKLTKPKV